MRIRFFISMVAVLSLAILGQAPATLAGTSAVVIEITGKGTLFHFETVTPGVKPFSSKITAATIAACITGSGTGCTISNLELDSGGKAYIYLVGGDSHHVFIATNPDCLELTELDGLVGGDGSFMFAGHHEKSGTNFVVQGTVTLDKTKFPKLVLVGLKKASVLAVSEPLEHYAVGTFAAVTGTAADVSCLP